MTHKFELKNMEFECGKGKFVLENMVVSVESSQEEFIAEINASVTALENLPTIIEAFSNSISNVATQVLEAKRFQ